MWKRALSISVLAVLFFSLHSYRLSQLPSAEVHAQGAADCNQVFTFTGVGVSPTLPTFTGGNAGCSGWRITWSVTGFTAATVTFQGSQDGATFAAFNTGLTQEGNNPTAWTSSTPSNSMVVRGYLPFVNVKLSSVTGAGSLTVTVKGYYGTSANLDIGGGGGTGATGATGPSGASGGSGPVGPSGVTGASGPAGVSAALTNITPVTVTANSTADQFLMEIPIAAGYLNTLGSIYDIHASGIATVASTRINFKALLCTVSGCGSGTVITLASNQSAVETVTSATWNVNFKAATTATGVSGTMIVHGPAVNQTVTNIALPVNDSNPASSSTIDLTAGLFLDFTAATSAGGGTTSITQQLGAIEPGAGTGPPGATGATGPSGSGLSGLTTTAPLVATSATTAGTPCTGCVLDSSGNLTVTGFVKAGSGSGNTGAFDSLQKTSGNIETITSPDNGTGGTATVDGTGNIVLATTTPTSGNCAQWTSAGPSPVLGQAAAPCGSGGGGGGSGITVYSGLAGVTLSNATIFFPIGGGSIASSTEASVDSTIRSATTVSNFGLDISAALGTTIAVNNTVVVTWRKNGSSQAVTCTITNPALSCSDTTHSFTTVAGDTLDVQAVFTGTITATPNFLMNVVMGTAGGTTVTVAPPYLTVSGLTYGPVFQITAPPAIGSLTWANQGSATATSQNGAILMSSPATSSDSIRALVNTSYPATPFTFTVGVIPNIPTLNFYNVGITVSDGAQFLGFSMLTISSVMGNFAPNYAQWTNSTTCCTGQIIPFGAFTPGVPIYLTLTDDGTNFTYWVSSDPLDLKRVQVIQVSRTAFLTPSQIGIFVDTNTSSSVPVSALFFHWSGV